MEWSALLRPELAEISAYLPADPRGARVRLDANEAPPNPSPAVREAVARAVARTPLERYPDARMAELKARIAQRTGARPAELLIGSGLDEVIALIVLALARPRSGASAAAVVSPAPTFVMYRTTSRAHGLAHVEVPLDSLWDLDVGAMTRAIERFCPNVVFLASPNNPTGNRMSDDRVEAVLRAARDALVVIDEAYADYAGASLRSWRSRFGNLAVMRTLSKLGLAALRVGWLEADENLLREIDKARQPFNVSATSQAAACAVLDDAWPDVLAHVQSVTIERERVARALRGIAGVEVAPSQANFLWVSTPAPADALCEALLARGVLVKSFHRAGGRLASGIRVTVGTASDNDAFLDAVRGALSG